MKNILVGFLLMCLVLFQATVVVPLPQYGQQPSAFDALAAGTSATVGGSAQSYSSAQGYPPSMYPPPQSVHAQPSPNLYSSYPQQRSAQEYPPPMYSQPEESYSNMAGGQVFGGSGAVVLSGSMMGPPGPYY